ncbi:MAG: glycosyltransferase [Bacteroidales bacterium]|nr:glycosyltransferase [Bacteroidales bacterium]
MSTKKERRISIIVPVFNRPSEIEELLASLDRQTDRDFEVVIVEDGSSESCMTETEKFSDRLNIRYYFKENSGPGPSRNYGFEKASGNYGIFLDSDCILPEKYIETVRKALDKHDTDAFGGPDRAHDSFTRFQKAVNYSMTSFFTTGGIRGGGEKMDKFYPRSFNMGYSREVFEKTHGFAGMRFGEDIDMSIRILENGFRTRLIKDAFVFHKRRTSTRQFFKQVFNSGIARINVYKRHPESLKLIHFLPAVFTMGLIALILPAIFWSPLFLLPVGLHLLLLLLDSAVRNRSAAIGLLSVFTSYIQLTGYGLGFITALWKRIILGKGEFAAFTKKFYK